MAETSIRKLLLSRLLIAVVALWGFIAGLIYLSSSHEINEVYDASLISYARVLASLIQHEAEEEKQVLHNLQVLIDEIGEQRVFKSPLLTEIVNQYRSEDTSKDYMSLNEESSADSHPYESKLAFMVRNTEGRVILRSANHPAELVFTEGFGSVAINHQVWRTYGLNLPKANYLLSVAELTETRSELLEEIIAYSLWPVLIMLPLLALMVYGITDRGLLPLNNVAQSIASRRPNSLQPLSLQNVPVEIKPLVNELNALFERVSRSLENEKRFTDNAAHELRTPLAVLKTHLQVLEMEIGKDSSSIRSLHQGIDRTTHLVEQLLTFARTENRISQGLTFEPVSFAMLISQVMLDLAPTALERNIELTFEDNNIALTILADSTLLTVVLRNVIDNAIRYTPDGGKVAVNLQHADGNLLFRCTDSGPGLTNEQLAKVFERFYRGETGQTEGAGLGLSLVEQILQLHNFKFRLQNCEKAGAEFIIKIPVA